MICLGEQKQLGIVGVTCQWQHCTALAVYKPQSNVICLYAGNYTTIIARVLCNAAELQ